MDFKKMSKESLESMQEQISEAINDKETVFEDHQYRIEIEGRDLVIQNKIAEARNPFRTSLPMLIKAVDKVSATMNKIG